ncbi:hypothetical protein MBRA1_003648 [Malassezia brasiliensis]|uniref:Uncharacterized protein n=1 Tax=Malassezia brasiliensis TaxID=1821822 RepID=A0AAF0DX30_9BASI|nr:hypothetical protein MBRA1_003648 [Malassezia brasiliensis]
MADVRLRPPRADAHGAPRAVHLARYVEALGMRAARAEQRLARPAPDTDAERWRLAELDAALQRAERMARSQHDDDAVRRVASMRDAVDSMQRVRGVLTQTLPGVPAHKPWIDAYWDDYLRAPTAADAAPREATSDAALLDEYGAGRPAPAPGAEGAAAPAGHTHERDVRDALSSELLRMAGVLKRNTIAFGDALERDRVLVEQAGTRLDQNLSLMTRTRGQLGAVSKKARSMGWFTLTSMAMVFVSWAMMYIVIKLT